MANASIKDYQEVIECVKVYAEGGNVSGEAQKPAFMEGATINGAPIQTLFDLVDQLGPSDSKVQIDVLDIVAKGAFTVSPADAAHVAEADYFGIATGRKVDKAAASGLTFVKSEFVDAPVIEEFPLAMECEVTSIQGDEHGARIVGKVVNTRVDESILDGEGRVDFAKMRPIVYDSARRIYRVVGEEVGGAWDAGKALM